MEPPEDLAQWACGLCDSTAAISRSGPAACVTARPRNSRPQPTLHWTGAVSSEHMCSTRITSSWQTWRPPPKSDPRGPYPMGGCGSARSAKLG
jgi:hypothetical protein